MSQRFAGCQPGLYLRRFLPAFFFAPVLILPTVSLGQPVPGQNINMVSGTSWPGGDPFLQRQNEPSIAVSSENSLHLLAGANDYRTVDLPAPDIIPGAMAGDAWLGLFKSFDGGQSWQSTLLPGYPQDASPQGLASPLKGFRSGADPTVRAGTHGLFYYSGIVFNRGTNQGLVFVSTFLDTNRKENGDATQNQDTIRYLGAVAVDTGTSGQFLDKPWIAVDIPRTGAGSCSFPLSPTETVPAGNVYLAWSRFTGSSSTKIMFSRSLDCGKTWSNPIKLSESNSINQGTSVAVDPATGDVYVVWRRFASSSEPDAILFAKSTNFGRTFPSRDVVEVARILPFDQPTSPTSFRTNTLPTLAVSVDSAGVSRIHVSWAARPAAGADAQIFLATSADGANWGTPAPVDTAPITDDFGGSFSRGNRFMPQLTFTAGRLMLLYYDQRLDHTLGLFQPNTPFSPDAQGRFYLFKRDPRGELVTNPGAVFTLFVDDRGLTQRRHTIDLRVAQAAAGPAPNFASALVSQYSIGLRSNLKDEAGNPLALPIQWLEQLQANPPNLPLFQQGTLPFIGDYIDIAGQAFLQPATPTGPWRFNTASAPAPVHYAVWTDNRDVRPPADGDWTRYTPVGGGGPSLIDPSQNTPACVSGQEGMRNQNIYSSRITEGLFVSSPQNAKPLSATFKRAFAVTVQNSTSLVKHFRLSIANQPPGGHASLLPTSLLTSLDVSIGGNSGVARPVFATSSNPAASITVNVNEISAPGGSLVAGGLSSFLVLNPEGSVSPLAQPDGSPDDILSSEIYAPALSLINISNVNPFINISNPNEAINISNINISNPSVGIINISNPNEAINISNINISNPDPAVINISNINISNATAANINISNASLGAINISNAPVSDATYLVKNSGNTSHSYHVKLVGNAPPGAQLQLIVNKTHASPASANCQLRQHLQGSLLASVHAPIVTSLANVADPNIADSSLGNATIALAPGESALVTVRGNLDLAGMASLTAQLAPAIVAHGANTTGGANPFATLLQITSNGTTLPVAVVGVPYTAALQAFGGKPPYSWTITSGTLPPGLQLSSNGTISGTPTAAGLFNVQFQASDSSSPTPQTTQKTVSFTVNGRKTATSITFGKNPVVVAESSLTTISVTDTEGSGAASSPSGTVTVTGDASVTGGSCNLTAAGAGVASCSVPVSAATSGTPLITAAYGGSTAHAGSSGSAILTVQKRTAAVAVAFGTNPVLLGGASSVTATVTDASPEGTASAPGGTVSFSSSVGADSFAPSGSCILQSAGPGWASCSVNVTPSAIGARTITASYSGSGSHAAASGSATLNAKGNSSTTVTSDTPDPSVAGQAVTIAVSVAPVAPASGTPSGSVAVTDGVASCTAALAGGSGSCSLTLTIAGARTLTATYSGDALFQPSSATEPHQVLPPQYTFIGFSTPLSTAGTLSAPSMSGTFNLGRAVPIKWQLKDASGAFISRLSTTTRLEAVFNSACAGAPGGPAILLYSPTGGATGGSTFRYDTGNNQFIFNWDTSTGVPTGPGCYTIVLQLDDGSLAKATTLRLE